MIEKEIENLAAVLYQVVEACIKGNWKKTWEVWEALGYMPNTSLVFFQLNPVCFYNLIEHAALFSFFNVIHSHQ